MKSEKNNITRRTFIKELGIVSTSTLSFLSVNTPANINSPTDLNKNNPDKPNILLLMTDQMRWDAMGCSGGWVNTPNLDRIASEGIRFTNCVTTSPVCVPARLSLATGLYPHNTGVWNNQKHKMSSNTPTWMQSVRDAGYRTSLFGKTHLHPHSGDLREKEDLMNAYGLDDVDEIGGPRANMKTLSHMTALWEEKGIWKPTKRTIKKGFEQNHILFVLPLMVLNTMRMYTLENKLRNISRHITVMNHGSVG